MQNIYLTKRRSDVLRLLAKGLKNEEIGAELEMSVHTVKSHIEKLFKYFNAKTRIQIVTSALKAKVIFIEDL